MNYCLSESSNVWGYALSALIGSALTIVAFELRRKSTSIHCHDDITSNNGAGETITSREEGNIKVNGEGIKVKTIREDALTPSVTDNGNGQAPYPSPPIQRLTISERPSFSGSFNDIDGEKRHSLASIASVNSDLGNQQQDAYADGGTNVVVLSEQGWFSDDKAVMQAKEFDEQVVSKLKTLDESNLLLHRTRAVSALASRLMAARDEQSCYEVVSSLLVPLFCVDRCSYVLMKDADHIIVKGVAVKKRKHAVKLGLDGVKKYGGVIKPIKGTMIAACKETLQQQYCPRSKDSALETQRMMHTIGINTILATPILVDGNKFAGAVVISMTKEDAFKEYDKILIQDIASMLGANIYAKRMRKSAENSHRISREMLHSMIPSKVIEKIQVFWDQSSGEYQSRRSSNIDSLTRESTCDSSAEDYDELDTSAKSITQNKNSNKGRGRHQRIDSTSRLMRRNSVDQKINFLNHMNATGDPGDGPGPGVILDTSAMEIGSFAQALYAENVKDVVIIFTDVVGFSKMALDMKPLEVVDMLQALFGRFDILCDKHGVQKLETIGDAYICTTNLFDEDQDSGNVKHAALSALNMAKDMILATQEVMVPGRVLQKKHVLFETLEIRVGIHIGEVTCGVLGERLPKFTVFGHNVNLAARMEQTSRPNMIRATEEFRSLVADAEDDWDEYEVIQMKNMGAIGTYILDPLRGDDGFHF